jgi:hypothetical protein
LVCPKVAKWDIYYAKKGEQTKKYIDRTILIIINKYYWEIFVIKEEEKTNSRKNIRYSMNEHPIAKIHAIMVNQKKKRGK